MYFWVKYRLILTYDLVYLRRHSHSLSLSLSLSLISVFKIQVPKINTIDILKTYIWDVSKYFCMYFFCDGSFLSELKIYVVLICFPFSFFVVQSVKAWMISCWNYCCCRWYWWSIASFRYTSSSQISAAQPGTCSKRHWSLCVFR